MGVAVPAALADDLAVYTDSNGFMKLLAPTGWVCKAEYGADGSGGIAIYPKGQSLSEHAFGTGWSLPSTSKAEAVVGSQTGGCEGCEVGQACALFQVAARQYQSGFERPCSRTRPASEAVHQLSPGLVSFQDPPGTTGEGSPSGGRNAANGVMTFYDNSAFGSWLDTCTLPQAKKALCTASLNSFITWYGEN
jgi:hypothetical protein